MWKIPAAVLGAIATVLVGFKVRSHMVAQAQEIGQLKSQVDATWGSIQALRSKIETIERDGMETRQELVATQRVAAEWKAARDKRDLALAKEAFEADKARDERLTSLETKVSKLQGGEKEIRGSLRALLAAIDVMVTMDEAKAEPAVEPEVKAETAVETAVEPLAAPDVVIDIEALEAEMSAAAAANAGEPVEQVRERPAPFKTKGREKNRIRREIEAAAA